MVRRNNFVMMWIIICMILVDSDSNKNCYQILDVSVQSKQAEIKAAFRRKAMKMNPDKPKMPNKDFKYLFDCYDVLSDKDKRIIYNKNGYNINTVELKNHNQNLFDGLFKDFRKGNKNDRFNKKFDGFSENFRKVDKKDRVSNNKKEI
eukprot:430132_1